jgi:hypothetical protein
MVEKLRRQCIDFVLEHGRSPEDVLSVFTSCMLLDEPELQKWCAYKIVDDTRAVLASADFLRLSPKALALLLQAPTVSVPEVELFKAVCIVYCMGDCERDNKRERSTSSPKKISISVLVFLFLSSFGLTQAPTTASDEFRKHILIQSILNIIIQPNRQTPNACMCVACGYKL